MSMFNHPSTEDAFETIDAAIYSGDPSLDEIDAMMEYIERWQRRLPQLKYMHSSIENAEKHFDEAFRFNGTEYVVPEPLKAFVIDLCIRYDIKGICDPMYIANVIAFETGVGTGESSFSGELPSRDILDEKSMAIAQRLATSYGNNIPQSHIADIAERMVTKLSQPMMERKFAP